jgi:hypothetical protein
VPFAFAPFENRNPRHTPAQWSRPRALAKSGLPVYFVAQTTLRQ